MKIIKQKPNLEGMTNVQLLSAGYFSEALADLLAHALARGVVLTVNPASRQPLAMGNYDLVIEARPLRNYVEPK